MTKCNICRWRDVCDLDCGDPQGYSYSPVSEEERRRMERGEEDGDESHS